MADDDFGDGDPQVADAGLGDCWAITGGAGHVGLELGRWLARRGVAVRALDLAPPLPDGLDDGIRFVRGDVTDAAAVSALLAGEFSPSAEPSADVLVHLAGAGMSGGAMLDRDLCERVNVGGAETCVECCRRHAAATGRAVCMIYLSTYNVAFSGSVVTDGDEDLGYSRAEDHTDEYSKSKMIAERAVLSANGHGGVATIALRPAAIFGERESRHLPRIMRLMEWGMFAVAIGDKDALQDWVHVDNLVDAIGCAARALRSKPGAVGGRPYFINDGEPVNTRAFLLPLARSLGCNLGVGSAEAPMKFADATLASAASLKDRPADISEFIADAPLVRVPLGGAIALGHVCEVAWRWLGVPPLLTRAEVYKSSAQVWLGEYLGGYLGE